MSYSYQRFQPSPTDTLVNLCAERSNNSLYDRTRCVMRLLCLNSRLLTFVVLFFASTVALLPQDLGALQQAMETFTKVFRQINTTYVDQTDPNTIVAAGIEGMMSQLDPYSVYLRGQENEPFDQLSGGTYVGFGYVVARYNGRLFVTDVRPGMPAWRGGLRRGDRLCSVDGIRVDTLDVDSLRSFTLGAVGSKSVYRILRTPSDTLQLTLEREVIPVQNIGVTTMLANGIGYIELQRFSRKAPSDLTDSILSLRARGELHGLILDLRGNPGGLLEAAIAIGNMFLPTGSLISYTIDRIGNRTDFVATAPPFDVRLPLVVLVNEYSASASEVLAGALQDQDRAVIVGRTSFGKGLVQNVLGVNDTTTVKLTTARYYTPSGRCVQRRFRQDTSQSATTVFTTRTGRTVKASSGIIPDVEVSDSLLPTQLSVLFQRGAILEFASQTAASKESDANAALSDTKLLRQFLEFVDSLPDNQLSSTLENLRNAIDSARAMPEPPSTIAALESARKIVRRDVLACIRSNSATVTMLLRAEIASCQTWAGNGAAKRLPLDKSVQTAHSLIVNGRYAGFLDGDSAQDQ